MIASLKPYPAMKDSGVAWLGSVPEHWELHKLRSVLRRVTERNRQDLPLLSVVRERGVVRRDRSSNDENHNYIPDDLSNYKVVRVGQFAMNKMKAWQGSYGVAQFEGIVSPAYFVFEVLGPTGSFFHTAIRSRAYVPSFTQSSDGVRVGQWDLNEARMREVTFALPTPSEQAAIVRFLHHADWRVRRFVHAKLKLIKLLNEQKQVIIHRAVTRGLDPGVRLKPSGVALLGDVPEHWEVVPLCAIARPRKQTNQPHRDLLSVYLGRGVIPFGAAEERRTNPTSEDLSKYQAVEPGDFVLNNQQAWRGSVGVSRYVGIVSPAYLVLNMDGRLTRDFADWLLSGRAMVAQYLVSSKGVGSIQRNLYWPHLRRVAVLVPPPVEQLAIARFLEETTASLVTTIERARREIGLLRDFRTRLIVDVVTGKLDVREAAARLPDQVEEPERLDEVESEMEEEAGAGDSEGAAEEAEA